jgi:hypothetical protein
VYWFLSRRRRIAEVDVERKVTSALAEASSLPPALTTPTTSEALIMRI